MPRDRARSMEVAEVHDVTHHIDPVALSRPAKVAGSSTSNRRPSSAGRHSEGRHKGEDERLCPLSSCAGEMKIV